MIDEVIEGVCKGAGKRLPLQVNGNEMGTGVDLFGARHALPPVRVLESAVRGLMGTRVPG